MLFYAYSLKTLVISILYCRQQLVLHTWVHYLQAREQTHVLCCCFASHSHCYCQAKKECRNQGRQLKAQQERKPFASLLLFWYVDCEQVIVFRGHFVKWVIIWLSILVMCMSVGDRWSASVCVWVFMFLFIILDISYKHHIFFCSLAGKATLWLAHNNFRHEYFFFIARSTWTCLIKLDYHSKQMYFQEIQSLHMIDIMILELHSRSEYIYLFQALVSE